MITIKKIRAWGNRWGYWTLFKKPFLILFSPIITRIHPKHTFYIDNKKYNLFYHRYNLTWTKERAVEIPYALSKIQSCKGSILEVGNVIQNYISPTWTIVDKYEKAKGVLNEDINTYKPKNKYDLIMSISTFEHIGWDEDGEPDPMKSQDKIMTCFNNLKKNCLNHKGKIIISIPIGWNPGIDNLFFNNKFKFNKIRYIERIGPRQWIQVPMKSAKKCKYGKPYAYANCIAIGEYTND